MDHYIYRMQQGKRGTQIPGKQKSKVNFVGGQGRFPWPAFYPLLLNFPVIESCHVSVIRNALYTRQNARTKEVFQSTN